MTEMIDVPGGSWGDEVSDAVVNLLVRQGKLPADFQFRLHGATNDWRERHALALQDIMAALGEREPTGDPYLDGPLPDAVFIPGSEPIRPLLTKIDADYHILSDLFRIAKLAEAPRHLAWQSWARYVKHISPDKYTRIEEIMSSGQRSELGPKRSNYIRAIGRVVLKDEPLLEIHQDPDAVAGHGPESQRLLRELLLDNHLELGA